MKFLKILIVLLYIVRFYGGGSELIETYINVKSFSASSNSHLLTLWFEDSSIVYLNGAYIIETQIN